MSTTPLPESPLNLPSAGMAAVDRFDAPGGWVQGLRYGFMGFPLAFVALPLYVLWPHHMATQWGVGLATLGALLLAVRLGDAVIDPVLGHWVDRQSHGRSPDGGFRQKMYQKATNRLSSLASVLLVVGFAALFFPLAVLVNHPTALLVWAGVALTGTYLAFSVLTVLHQAWAARLGGNAAQRARVVGWREGWALCGVVVASVLPTVLGLSALVAGLGLALVLACWGWSRAAVPEVPLMPADTDARDRPPRWRAVALPLAQQPFRRLLAVYVVNGMASAVPATLLLFFVQDRLQAPAHWQPLFLGSYFVCAAAGIPLWLRAVARWGLAPTWAAGMALSVAVFAWVLALDTGDAPVFLVVCLLSGLALGADVVLPPALLNGLIHDLGHRGRSEGAYMGWWSFATKLNLALAAGLALPLLGWLGYAPGHTDPDGLWALTLAYAGVPCALKLCAGGLLYAFFIRKDSL